MISIDQEIFKKYYEGALADGLIWTLTDYALKKGYAEDEDDEGFYDHPEIKEHGDTIKTVLTLDISIYVFRRLNGPWGEVIDALMGHRNRLVNQYRDTTGFQVVTGNEDLYL